MTRSLLFAAPLAGLLLGCTQLPEFRPVLLQGETAEAVPDEDDYLAGKRHLAANQLGLAIDRFRARIAHDRADMAALNALAACYDRIGRFDLADRYYGQALTLAPDDAQTLNNAGISHLMRGQVQQALVLLAEAGRVAPEDATVQANLGRARHAETLVTAEEEVRRPTHIRRVAGNAWSLTTRGMVQPVSFMPPRSVMSRLRPDAVEPPLPLPVPRPAVVRSELESHSPPALKLLNGVGRRGMAARMRDRLAAKGWHGGSIGDAATFTAGETVLSYRPDRSAEATRLAALLPAGIRMTAATDLSHDLVLVLGRDLIPFDTTR